jgi:hypothetical protein
MFQLLKKFEKNLLLLSFFGPNLEAHLFNS